jgi:WhiB family redox-sensing transcriptional regulator
MTTVIYSPELLRIIDHPDRHCRGMPLDTFIPAAGEDEKEIKGWALVRHREKAKPVCKGCPVMWECRKYAYDNRMVGVWGGTDETEREKMRERNESAEALAKLQAKEEQT